MKKYQGMTFIGLVFTLAIIVFAAIVVMRIVPVYLQYYSVIKSIESLREVPASSLSGDPAADVQVLRNSLSKRMDVNGLDDLKPNELIIAPDGANKFKLHLNYQVIRPLFYNMSLLFNFDKFIEVEVGSGS